MAVGGMIAGRTRSGHEGELLAAERPIVPAEPRAGEVRPSAPPGAGDATPTGVRLDRARNGDRSALWRLLEEQRSWMLPLARRLLPRGVKLGPSELVVGAYQAAIKGIHRFRSSDKPSFRAWLKTILVRVRNRWVRRRDGDREEPLPDGSGGSELRDPRAPVEDQLAIREKIEWMNRALDYLEDRDREILRLHYYDGLTFEQMGDRLDQSPAALRQRVHRLLERLRQGIPLLMAMHSRRWGPVRCRAIGWWHFRAWSRARVARELDLPEAAVAAWIRDLPIRIRDADDRGDKP
jgi:RNA polymerase sigma factor (sigma-70 family)